MAHYVEMTHGGRIVRMAIADNLSIEEYCELSAEVQGLMRQTSAQVHVIVDSFAMKRHPVSVTELKRCTTWANEENFASLHHVSQNRFVTLIGDAVIAVMMKHYQAVETLEAAYEAIYALDPSVPVGES